MRTYEATDLRDKILARLGLANDIHSADFTIDYNMPLDEVYLNVALHCIEKTENLDWLAYCGEGPSRSPLLPSWVPDWTCHTRPEPFCTRTLCSDGQMIILYNASNVPFYTSKNRLVLGTNMTLTLTGFCVDRLHWLGEVALNSVEDTRVERSWAPSNPTVRYQLTGETLEEAYLHTVVADVTGKTMED